MIQEAQFSRNQRAPSPNLKIKKDHKSQQFSSLNTSHQSLDQQYQYPEEGKLLNFIIEIEELQQKSIFNLKLISFSLEDVQQKLAITDDPNNSQLRRQWQYHKHYYQEFQYSLKNENVHLGNSLQNQKISQNLRSRMVDWMIEVLGNYIDTTTNSTFFRSVSIMDYFLLKSNTQYSDQHLHLIGISSMFIATKLEDIYHIPLEDFVQRVGHNKYSILKVKDMEKIILETLNYEITFPTILDRLYHLFYQCFSLNDDPNLQNILEASIFILKMCLHDYSINFFHANTLAATSFFYSIRDFVIQKDYENQEQILDQFINRITQISEIDLFDFNQCQVKLKDLINSFKKKYPDLQNLNKFS
ncbi:unnamed protein product [Paramecium pentaurelia]|uniref:Cyclin-like domain-containing protein n=1 Tax=Paramecium pentaurelia TaxID=43138 RepID=A0A8S1VFS5_9CILI|nr:unnamed protein product [Paramecium pentaurelia]